MDESYQLPTKGNNICLSAINGALGSLQTPLEDSRIFCDWLITNLNEAVNQVCSSSMKLMKNF